MLRNLLPCIFVCSLHMLPLSLQVPHILPRLCFVMPSFPSPLLPNPLLADLAVLSSPIRLLSLLLLKACSQTKVVLTDLWWLCSEPAAPPARGSPCFAPACAFQSSVSHFLQAASQPSAIWSKRKHLLQGCQLESGFSKCALFVSVLGVAAVSLCTVNSCFVLV